MLRGDEIRMILFISGSVNEALGLGTPLTHMPCIYWETA